MPEKTSFKTLRYNFYMAKFVFKYIPSYVVVTLFDSIFFGYVKTWIDLTFTKEIFNYIETLIKANNPDFVPVAKLFLLVLAVEIINHVLNIYLTNRYYPLVTNRLTEKMQMILYDKVKGVDLSCYDDPEYYDNFVWSMKQSASRAMESFGYIPGIIKVLLSLSAVISVIYNLDWVAVIIVVVGVCVRFISNKKLIKINYKKDVDINTVDRKINYINRVFYLSDYAKEIRLNNITDLMLKKFDQAVDEQKRITMINIKNKFIINLISSFSIDVFYQVVFYLIMAYRIVITKTLTIGGMMVVEQATKTLSTNINSFLDTINSIKSSSMYIKKYVDFMNYQPKVYENKFAKSMTNKFDFLSFKNVSFKYESSSQLILKNISFDIKQNEKIAIVGYNGAGKSTLIKLILRLYEPESGQIYINGDEIHNVTIDSYRNKFATVFQDFKLFSITLAENVLMDKYSSDKELNVKIALEKANFSNKLNRMPMGINTVLTREFDDDGTILSGGEMQKVAIARTFAKDKEFIIMDEPSSALDADSEYELNKIMMNSAFNKTVVFISHRLSTTRMADRILMMEKGRIIENGSHTELMAQNGKYAEMFRMQAEKYLC
ncbi:MAG: hypothetical protein DBX47_07225 [Clostridiales bacterium]|nr:MAG: hypothetical protein DBX47_07225 [Clostridiales bacterium]